LQFVFSRAIRFSLHQQKGRNTPMSKPRIVVSGVFYEVTSKGARGTAIFDTDELKSFFLTEFSRTLEKFSYQCYGWSLLDDHYHLILKSSDISISKFMQRINSIYAKHYNKVKNEQGTVFYRRFASVIAEQETCLKDLIRYVHLNPVRCGTCTLEHLDTYKWCGHHSLTNNESDQIQNTSDVLKIFAGSNASTAYHDFIHRNSSEPKTEKFIQDIRNANNGLEKFSQPEPWVIGTPKFVREILERDRCNRARTARHTREDITCENIHDKIKVQLNITDDEFFRQGRLNIRTKARLLFAYVGVIRFDYSGADLAKYLGVTRSAISRMLSRWKTVEEREKLFRDVMKGIKTEQCIEGAVV
jgi:REP element-mobilizing transposase RayT